MFQLMKSVVSYFWPSSQQQESETKESHEEWKCEKITLKINVLSDGIEITTPHGTEIKKATITFNKNEMTIGENDGIQIFSIENKREINYQDKQYELTKEELLAVYFDLIIREVEMKWIIKSIELSEEHPIIMKSLQLINIFSITFNGEQRELDELDEEEYEQVDTIIEGHRKYQKFKKQIERMQQIMKKTNDTSHLDILNIEPNDYYSTTENAMEKIKRTLTCKERTKYKLYSLDDNYALFLASMYFGSLDDLVNFEFAIPRAKNNMSKFFYNPVPIDKKSREWFDHLQTLYLYSPSDERFENDKRIIARHPCKMAMMWFEEWWFLKQFVNKKKGEIVFDSDKDNWNDNTIFNERIIGRSCVAVVIEDTKGNRFGGYVHKQIESIDSTETMRDQNAFLFSLNSNGRLKQPMKFKSINEGGAEISLSTNTSTLIRFGNDNLTLFSKRMKPSYQNEWNKQFNFPEWRNVMTGMNRFTASRIVVIQFF